MLVKQYHSVKDFFQENLLFLEKQEASNNLLIGIPFSMMGEKEKANPPNLFSVFDETGSPVFSLVQTSPKNFLIYGSDSALEYIIPFLKNKNIKASGVIGAKDLTISFAETWKKHTQQDWRINFQQLICQLDEVNSIPLSPGKLRKAKQSDLQIIENWFVDFAKEAMNSSDAPGAMATAQSKIASGTLYLWEDQHVVSMAAIARPTRNGITVNYVYTPSEFRGCGYASSCVALMSKKMLEHYQFCCLFTDATNPTSNKIYQNMGYYPIAEFREILFI